MKLIRITKKDAMDPKQEFQKFKTLTFGGQKPREVKPDYMEWRWTNKRGIFEFLSLQLQDGYITVEDNGGDYDIDFDKSNGFQKVKAQLKREYK